jgi:hypothetical protein
MTTVLTIGHSNLSIDAFFALLRLNPNLRLAGFAQWRDLTYFLRGVVGGAANRRDS